MHAVFNKDKKQYVSSVGDLCDKPQDAMLWDVFQEALGYFNGCDLKLDEWDLVEVTITVTPIALSYDPWTDAHSLATKE